MKVSDYVFGVFVRDQCCTDQMLQINTTTDLMNSQLFYFKNSVSAALTNESLFTSG